MKFDSTAPMTGAMEYRIKYPLSVAIFGPIVRAGFMLAPVSPPKQNDKIATINPTPNANLNKLAFLLTRTCIEYIRSSVMEISIAHVLAIETLGVVAPSTTIIAAKNAPRHCAIM